MDNTAKASLTRRLLPPTLTCLLGLGVGMLIAKKSADSDKLPIPQTDTQLLEQLHTQDSGCTLPKAIQTGNMRALVRMLHDKKLINRPDEQGNTPLHLAAISGRADMVYVLQRAGANALATNREKKLPSDLAQDIPTRRACLYGEALRKIEKGLLDRLHRGDSNNIAPEVSQALKLGINPNATTDNGLINLLCEVIGNMCPYELVQEVLEAGADPNIRQDEDYTPLHRAVDKSRNRVVTLLLEAGADPMAYKNDGETPLHFAIRQDSTLDTFIALLPGYKACNFNPFSPTRGYAARMALGYTRPHVVNTMIKFGMNVNHPLMCDEPLLIKAVRENRPVAVEVLINGGADLNAVDKHGKRAIDYAPNEDIAAKLRR